jgi:hypothetical protein
MKPGAFTTSRRTQRSSVAAQKLRNGITLWCAIQITPIALARNGERFEPTQCRTLSGKAPGASQVTALLRGEPHTHAIGPYEICFRAVLVEPWAVKMVRPQPGLA